MKLPLPASVFAWASFERERGGRESAHERDRKGERKIDLRKWLMKTQRLASSKYTGWTIRLDTKHKCFTLSVNIIC